MGKIWNKGKGKSKRDSKVRGTWEKIRQGNKRKRRKGKVIKEGKDENRQEEW